MCNFPEVSISFEVDGKNCEIYRQEVVCFLPEVC